MSFSRLPIHGLARFTHRRYLAPAVALVVFTFLAFGAIGFAPMAPDTSDISVHMISEPIASPHLSQQMLASDTRGSFFLPYTFEQIVHSGDTLSSLLRKLGVNDRQAEKFIASKRVARDLIQLKAGTVIQARTDEKGQLHWLRTTFRDTKGQDTSHYNLLVYRDNNADDEVFRVFRQPVTLERRIEMHSGVIRSSLFAATDAAGLADSIALQMVMLFGTHINFASDLRHGDCFSLVYETFWQDGQRIKTGRILAATFINNGKRYTTIFFNGGYYDEEGRSLKQGFLKSPLAFTRVSSGFSMRKHPISGQWKRHNGVDFAAPIGTPIHVTADGVVSFIGSKGSYGNVVFVKHRANITTVYAHMSRFGRFKKGDRVSQDDVIGYVGMTGWATGPHVHYEFRIANRPWDPMSVKVPTIQVLNAIQMKDFKNIASSMGYRLTLLAAAD